MRTELSINLSASRAAKKGNVLLICLALMFIMTLWAVSSTRNSGLSLQANYNARMKQISFEAAEFALRQVEQIVLNEVTLAEHVPALYNGTNGRYSLAFDRDPLVEMAMLPAGFDIDSAADWLDTSYVSGLFYKDLSYIEVEYDNDPDSPNYMERQPRVVVEFLGRDDFDGENGVARGRTHFRISAIAWGPHGLASSVIRSHVAVNF